METKFVVCIDSGDWPDDLLVRKIYRVLPDEHAAELGWIRVIDETEEDYLYPSDCFMPIDLTEEVEQALYATASLV
ncbi:MAG: hypothetical protein OXL37_18080 [Chloroflexota bacterium]|nr:hypothetical protein [Chloroflexota bacterium]MDE2958879.1 hypothetical protein [Chloroflexota bacterium]